MTKRDEKTSARIAKIAGSILAARFPENANIIVGWYRNGLVRELTLTGHALNAVCASALTQAAPRKPTRGKGAKRLGKSIVRRGLKRPRKKPGSKVWTG